MSLGIGVIGCGQWGPNHVRVFNELPDSTVVGVCDRDENRLRLMRERYPTVATFVDFRALLAESKVECVVVAVPASLQYGIIKDALKQRKHVLAEKPFVLDVAQGMELVELAERYERMLMVGYVFLYNPAVTKLKQYMNDSREGVGKVYYLHASRTNLGPIRQDVNVAWDLASHDISIFSYLLDSQPVSAHAVGSKFLRESMEDVVFITLAYPNGEIGHIHVSWADPDRVRQVVVVGSQMRLVFDDLNTLEKLKIFHKSVFAAAKDTAGKDTDSFGEFVLAIRDGDIVSPKVEASEPLKSLCAHFLECVRQNGSPLTDGRLGVDVVRVLTAVQRSLDLGGVAVEVSRVHCLR